MITLTQQEVDKIGKLVDTTKDWNELEALVHEKRLFHEYNKGRDGIGQNYILLGACYASLQMTADEKKDRTRARQADVWDLSSLLFPRKQSKATIVQKEGIDYYIHGLAHVNNRERYMNGIASFLICETNFTSIFKLRNAVAQTRIDECKYVPFLDYARNFYPYLAPNLIQLLMAIKGKKSKEKMFCQKEVKSYSNAGISEREVIGIEEENSSNKAAIINLEDIMLPDRHTHTYIEAQIKSKYVHKKACMLRSLSHAEFLENIAKSMELKKAHGLYGLLHEPQIAYFLRNPKKAEELRQRFSGNPLRTAAIAISPLQYPAVGGLMTYYFGKEFLKSWSDDSSIFWTGLMACLALSGITKVAYSAFRMGKGYQNWKKIKEIQKEIKLLSS